MKLTIPKTTLASTLSRVQGICSGRNTMAILSNVLLHAWPKALHLSATDLEVGYTTMVEGAGIEKAGKITLPAKKLHEIIAHIPTDNVTLELCEDNCRVNITGGTYFSTLAGIAADEFPAMPPVNGDTFDLDASAILRLLGHVDYCMSKDEKMYHLCGVLLQVQTREEENLSPRLIAAATDGHRLACDSSALPGEPRPVPKDLLRGCIVSRKGVGELKKLRTEGILVITIAGNNLSITTEYETLFLRLVDGEFPNWRAIVPANIAGTIETKRSPLIDALDRVSLLSADNHRGTTWDIAEGGINFRATNPELGEASDRVTAVVGVDPREFRLNANYINQALTSMDCGIVQIHLPKDELSPIKITPTCEEEPFAVIMPMRL